MTTSSSTDGSKTPNRSESAAQPKPRAAEPAPDPELLEFLGEFSDERGEFVDPIDLDDAGDADPNEHKDGGK
jgi:hypothetical protein